MSARARVTLASGTVALVLIAIMAPTKGQENWYLWDETANRYAGGPFASEGACEQFYRSIDSYDPGNGAPVGHLVDRYGCKTEETASVTDASASSSALYQSFYGASYSLFSNLFKWMFGRGDEERHAAVERAQLQEQIAEEHRREQAEQVAEAQSEQGLREIQGLLDRLNQLDGADPDVRHRYQLKYHVVNELAPSFRVAQMAQAQEQDAVLQRLTDGIRRIVVPEPPAHTYFRRAFIGGLSYTAADALAQCRKNPSRQNGSKVNDVRLDPFTLASYDGCFGFADSSSVYVDWPRVWADHVAAQGDGLTEALWAHTILGTASGADAAELRRLKGATIDELVCHSNGCAIARALIAMGSIHVRRLRMLNGDCSLTCIDSLADLQQKTGVKICVYAVQGDVVPLLSTGWVLRSTMRKIGEPLQSYSGDSTLVAKAVGLSARPEDDCDAAGAVGCEILPAPPWTSVGSAWSQEVSRHVYTTIAPIIAAQTAMGMRRPSNCDSDVAAN